MKKSILLSMTFMISTIIFAQHKERDPQQVASRQTEKMKSALGLNDAQYASIKKINETYATRFSDFKGERKHPEPGKITEMKALRDQREKEINAVLTADQQ